MRVASLTLRLTLFFAAASTAVLLVVGSLVTASVDAHFVALDVVQLDGKLELVRQTLAKTRSLDDLDEVPQALDDALVGHPGLSILVLGQDARILHASSDTAFPVAAFATQLRDGSGDIEPAVWATAEHAFRVVVAPAPTGIAAMPVVTAVVAVNIDHERTFLAALRDRLWLAIALGALLMIVLGWIATRRGLAPIRRMAAIVQPIGASALNNRLQPARLPLELRSLAEAFNEMLGRLEDSFRRLSDFSSDIAHEMRTPVSNLVTQTQVALSRPRSLEEYREILYSALEEYDRLARMISDMLFLAKAANGTNVTRDEMVDLAAETTELLDFYGALAEERGIELRQEGAGSVRGEKLMLRRAISNLLSNAIRHARSGSAVNVALQKSASDEVQLTVENAGEDIPAQHLPRLFDRFYRVDPSRQKSSEGAGLGLAITKSIVEAHDGSISVTSSSGKTRFIIRLPVGRTKRNDATGETLAMSASAPHTSRCSE